MRLVAIGDFDDLERDMRRLPATVHAKVATATARNAKQGNKLGKSIAKESAGAHGKHYHKAFSAESLSPLVWEYGPDASKPQGGMSFEGGSRNQPPHNDLAKSADVQAPKWRRDVAKAMENLL